MAAGMGGYGSAMGGKAAGMGGGTDPIKPPKAVLSPNANMGAGRMGGIKPPVPKVGLGGAGGIKTIPTPIKQAPQMGAGRLPPPPSMTPSPMTGPTTPESRAAARAKLYGPGGGGWDSFGGAPPPQPADPASGGFGGGPLPTPGGMPGTGGPLMGLPPTAGGLGPPQQADPMVPPDFSQKLQALATTNPQLLQQILQMLG